jgi:multicomponent Na+:H+ antiporter subunit E
MTHPPPLRTIPEVQYPITPFGVVLRTASFIIAWWAFTEGDWREWAVAVAVIIAATLASFHILPLRSWRWNLKGLAQFIPFFLWQSILGGFDVAWRSFHPELPLNPGLQEYETKLTGTLPRVFLTWTISLLPGTASVDMRGQHLTIHVLNIDENFDPDMRKLEARIGRIFGMKTQ